MHKKNGLYRVYKAIVAGIVLAGMLLSLAGCAKPDEGESSGLPDSSSSQPSINSSSDEGTASEDSS